VPDVAGSTPQDLPPIPPGIELTWPDDDSEPGIPVQPEAQD
jgi:hypothetical protein